MNRAAWHLRANLVVLAWLAMAAIATVVHREIAGSGWLMVHLLLLGGASTAILIWSQHFADTLLRHPASRRALLARLALHNAGAVAVVVGVQVVNTPLVVVGGAAVAGAAAHQVVGIARQRGRALPARFAHLVRYYLAAAVFLVPGVGCGVAMARFPVGPEQHARLSVAHTALTLFGWIGLTVAGTLVVLWPTVLHARIHPAAESAARRALPVLVGGVVVLTAGPASGSRLLVAGGAAVVVAGIAMLGRFVIAQARSSTPRTFAAWSVAAALLWWTGTTAALGAQAALASDWEAAAAALVDLAPAFVVGFVAQVLVGSMSHLLPVVLGGGPAVQRRTSAALDRGGAARVVLLNGALLLYVAPVPSAVRVVTSLVGLGALVAFLVLAVVAVRRSRLPAPVPPATGPALPREPDPLQSTRHRGGTAAAVVGLLLAVVVGVAMDPVAAGLTDAASSQAGLPVAATGGTTTVQVTALDMRFSPREVEVPAGDRLVIELTNSDSAVHDLVLATGTTSGRLEPGETATVDAGVVSSDTDGWCSVAGHRLMGMTLKVVVTGSVADSASPAVEHEHGESVGKTDASAADDLDPGAEPDAAFRPWDAVLAPAATSGAEQSGGTAEEVDGATTHHVTLRAQEAEREVAPGVTQLAWTFNGAVPGPVLRGRVGDTFVVTLVNEGGIGHSLDFHAGALSPDEVMRTIAPGETLTYTFTATRSGIWMYHCSTAPMSLHIASGMFGAVIIDPPGLPAVDHEYLLVQSELYLGPQGGEADAAKVAAGDSDLVVFNGYAHQYRHRPLEVRTGDSARIWVLDAGPNRPSAFHVVGGQFSSVYREGDWVLRDGGSTGTGGSQVLALQPAEGGFVELDFPEAGTYPFVTHAMSDAESGASGRFLVTDR